MAITTSAKKAIRSAAKKRVFNTRRNDAMKKAVKEIKALTKDKKAKEAAALLPKVYQAIDKAAKTNFITKQAASRYKSRIAIAIKKVSA